MITAEYDPLRDEGIAYARRLSEAGVHVTHRHYEDMFHEFFSFVNLIDTANQAVVQVGAQIRALLAPRDTKRLRAGAAALVGRERCGP